MLSFRMVLLVLPLEMSAVEKINLEFQMPA
jgi:hypothetical protein